MRIVLLSNYAADRQESMLRYARLLAAGMTERGHEVRVVQPPVRLLRLAGSSGPLAKWVAYLDKYLLAPRYLRRETRDADIVHVCDHSNSMYLSAVGERPRLITCHDTLAIFAAQGRFPGQRIGATGRLLQRWITHGLVRAPFVVCVSRKTQQDLETLSGTAARPASAVIANPVNPFFAPMPRGAAAPVLAARGVPEGATYFLHVGSNSWYKNRPGAVRIFAELARSAQYATSRLLLAGKPADGALHDAIRASGAAERIHVLESVADEELRALYSDAEALLFPSREEGFGWPIVEAQACSCVVVTSNREPMREIAGDAAILIDPEQPRQAAAAILAEATQNHFGELREQGLRNVQRFQEGPVIDAYLDVYARVRAEYAERSSSARAQG